MAQTADSLNNTARVLLGMIAEGHTTGYAIKAEIERSTRLFWGASLGGIYPELRRLRAAGLVTVRDNPRGGAVRHAWRLTGAGRAALGRWLSDPSEPVLEMRNEALLRLRFAGVLAPAEQVAVVSRMRAAHERRADDLQGRLDAGGFDDPLHRMTIEFGLGWHEWAIGWCVEAERKLAGRRRGSGLDPKPRRPGDLNQAHELRAHLARGADRTRELIDPSDVGSHAPAPAQLRRPHRDGDALTARQRRQRRVVRGDAPGAARAGHAERVRRSLGALAAAGRGRLEAEVDRGVRTADPRRDLQRHVRRARVRGPPGRRCRARVARPSR